MMEQELKQLKEQYAILKSRIADDDIEGQSVLTDMLCLIASHESACQLKRIADMMEVWFKNAQHTFR